MSTVLLWLRNDLRLHDQPVLHAACRMGAKHLLPVLCLPDIQVRTRWGFARFGPHRRTWLANTIRNLAQGFHELRSQLLILNAPAPVVLPSLAHAVGASTLVCEDIAAPEEQAEVDALRAAGLTVHTVWQSSLLRPDRLPWPVQQLPAVFTPFREAVERAGLQPDAPLPVPDALPKVPPHIPRHYLQEQVPALDALAGPSPSPDARSAVSGLQGGESAALAHLRRYLARGLPHRYLRTRNGLMGLDYSSKWSPWLSTGALSPRQANAELRQFEATHGATQSSYWLWFELLWRDYFRFLHLRHGPHLFRARGLGPVRATPHDDQRFAAWCAGQTGQPLVDAAMRELATTGYLSNRLRQVTASFLVHDLDCDWRAGAAWFEAQLLDYDVYSNQGNWLYIAGRGCDPRGGRRFDPAKQAATYDADGAYRRLWGTQ
ncbi:DASH family cryptochrome [Comamonas testosteroni]|uniref:DASH family cryptochrome n=1 Tax=Comamonas testosteroni TaxID=285 RepID=UPI002DBE00BB|nr:DASH family cryptochrome [Comamonas testosteroni]MEB5966810.1 DASH family cryptochrome [Comamonas testosteroni]